MSVETISTGREKGKPPESVEAELQAKHKEELVALERSKKAKKNGVEGDAREKREGLDSDLTVEGVEGEETPSGEESDGPIKVEEVGMVDGVKDAFAASMIASGEKGGNSAMSWVKALAAGAVYFFKNFVGSVKGWWKKGKEKKSEGDDGGTEEKIKIPLLEEDFEVSKRDLDTRTTEFEDKVLSKNPDWFGYAEIASARYDVPISGIMAVASFESHFESDVVNPSVNSDATGLGQFLCGTWAEFTTANPDFSGVSRKDPEAMIMAIAWYAKEGAEFLGISPYDENAVAAMYLYHHNGPGGTKDFLNYVKDRTAFKVPNSYWGKSFYGIRIAGVNDYENYSRAVSRFARTVQATSDRFQVRMDALGLG